VNGTKVQIKYGFGKPADGSLKKAELAIDLDDRSLWTADENGVIVRVAYDTTEIEQEIEDIISSHDGDIANLQGQINANAGNISNNANNIEQLKNDFDNHDHAGVYEPVISPKNTAFNKDFGTTAGTVSEGNHTHNYSPIGHDHAGVYEPVINPKNSAFNKDFGTASGTVAQGNHNHSGVYEPVINPKNTAFNKDFGTTAGTVAEGSHEHALDDLSDVSAANPSRDDLLIWNGSSWSASSLDLIETALNFKGSTNVAQAAPAAEQGDLYVNNTKGTAAASWTGIAGTVVNAGNFIGYANSRWYLLGEMADIGVTDVVQGLGISVDDSKPAEPVVSVDRTETDKWYAAKIDSGKSEGETLAWSTADAEWMPNDTLIVKGGKVGIGTDSPITFQNGPTLNVGDTSDDFAVINVTTANTGIGYLAFSDDSSGGGRYQGLIQYNHSQGHLGFGAGAIAYPSLVLDASGNVGIGTTSPDALIDIRNSSGVDPQIKWGRDGLAHASLFCDQYGTTILEADPTNVGASSSLQFHVDGTERMSIDSDGNVGIGTDSPSPGVLEVVDSTANGVYFRGSTRGALALDDVAVADASSPIRWQASDDGNHIFYVANRNATTGATTRSVEHMRIDSSGNVGIGTDSPSQEFHLRQTSGDCNLLIESLSGASQIFFGDAQSVNVGVIRYDHVSDYMRFSTNSAERMRIDSSGKVGIGTDNPSRKLSILGSGFGARVEVQNANTGKRISIVAPDSGIQQLSFEDSLLLTQYGLERMLIDEDGRVGIGGQPGTRSAAEIAKEAKDTLARWKSTFDERMKAEPKADKKAVTLEITGDEFSTFPTEEALVEKLTARNIGGGNALLQVAGDGYFSGTVNATTINGKVTDVGDHIKAITPTQIANWDAGTGGGGGGATTDGRISDNDIIHWNEAYGWGNHADANYQPAGSYALTSHTHSEYLTSSSLDGYATESWVTSGYQPKGSYADASHTHAYVPLSGNSTINGTLTCTGDVIAYSDERLKDNVETLDGSKVFEMRGVSYTRDGKESSGVIAQELQKVAPELVHDDGDYLGVAYGNLVGYLIEAVKELKAEIEELKNG